MINKNFLAASFWWPLTVPKSMQRYSSFPVQLLQSAASTPPPTVHPNLVLFVRKEATRSCHLAIGKTSQRSAGYWPFSKIHGIAGVPGTAATPGARRAEDKAEQAKEKSVFWKVLRKGSV